MNKKSMIASPPLALALVSAACGTVRSPAADEIATATSSGAVAQVNVDTYRAAWQGNMTGSGVVCSLDRPFTVVGVSSGGMNMAWKFSPTGPQAGTASYDESAFDTHWTGSGSYTVQESGTEKLSLAVQGEGCAATSGQQICQGFSVSMELTPLDTNECIQP